MALQYPHYGIIAPNADPKPGNPIDSITTYWKEAMKKTLVLLFALISLRMFACVDTTAVNPQWALGVIGVGNYSLPVSGFHPFFLPGIQLTHMNANGKWTQRVAVEYTKHSELMNDPPAGSADMFYIEGTEQRTLLRVGLEHDWTLHRFFNPYVAVDLAGQLYKSDVHYTGGIAGIDERDEIVTKGIGLLPAVGFKSYFGKHIAWFAEYRAEAFVNSRYTKMTNYSGNVDTRPHTETVYDFNGGNIGHVGVQVMF